MLYVGKANKLRTRLKQYFLPGRDNRPQIPFLTAQIAQIDAIVVPSEKEALLLENTLIKKHQPKYNAVLKDDKSYISLMINHRHPWPMIRLVRIQHTPGQEALYFGPYTSARAARHVFELMARLFPLRQCSDEELKRRTRPCILYAIKRCIAPCVHKCTQQEYGTHVEGAIRFLRGQDREGLHTLYQEMQAASKALEFERAAALLQTIRQIEHVLESQHVCRMGGRNTDAFGLYQEDGAVLLVRLLFREGKLVGSEHDLFPSSLQEPQALLCSFLLQHYKDRAELPEEILLPLSIKQRELLEEILHKPKITTPQKGEKRKLVALAQRNAKALFQQQERSAEQQERTLLDMQELLKLNRYPARIECFDTSHLAGTDPVASLVAFVEGKRAPERTRHFLIRHIQKGDDYAALHQALSRSLRRAKEKGDLPDLVIVDGGRGQLSILLQVLKELEIATVDALAVAKQEGRHDRGMTQEQLFVPHHTHPILPPLHSPLLLLLQRIRDAAHHAALSFHTQRRTRRIRHSALDEIPGIGKTKKARLIRHFGSLQKIQSASLQELQQVEGLTRRDIANLLRLFSHPSAHPIEK